MLKASLQLRLGQQLTMTPQLQQAIRLLQLPSLELQAHIRELLETNVMLEADDDAEATAEFEALGADPNEREPPELWRGGASRTPMSPRRTWRSSRTPGPRPPPRRARRPGTPMMTSASRNSTTSAANPCTSTCCGNWSWRAWKSASAPSAARSSMPSTTTATSPIRWPRSPRRCNRRSTPAKRRSRRCWQVIQSFDPLGVGARTVGECLTLQLRALDPQTPGTGHRDGRRRAAPGPARDARHWAAAA